MINAFFFALAGVEWGLTRDILEPLAAADGEEPVMPLAALLGRCLELSAPAMGLVDVLILREHSKELR